MATISCDPEMSSLLHPAGLEVFRGRLDSTPSLGILEVGVNKLIPVVVYPTCNCHQMLQYSLVFCVPLSETG